MLYISETGDMNMEFINKICKLITKFFPLWVVIFSLLAFLYPAPLMGMGGWITYLLGLIMYGDFKPKFVKHFANIRKAMVDGLNLFHAESSEVRRPGR